MALGTYDPITGELISRPERQIRVPLDRPLTMPETEQALAGALQDQEDAVEELERRDVAAGVAEAKYRSEYAKAFLCSSFKTEKMKDADAMDQCSELLFKRKIADGLVRAAVANCKLREETVNTLRSVNTNARAAETGR